MVQQAPETRLFGFPKRSKMFALILGSGFTLEVTGFNYLPKEKSPLKKLIYIAVIALSLIGSVAADGPWPPSCMPNCGSTSGSAR
jgi:hypothetical protein